jgi:hypothetical protein
MPSRPVSAVKLSLPLTSGLSPRKRRPRHRWSRRCRRIAPGGATRRLGGQWLGQPEPGRPDPEDHLRLGDGVFAGRMRGEWSRIGPPSRTERDRLEFGLRHLLSAPRLFVLLIQLVFSTRCAAPKLAGLGSCGWKTMGLCPSSVASHENQEPDHDDQVWGYDPQDLAMQRFVSTGFYGAKSDHDARDGGPPARSPHQRPPRCFEPRFNNYHSRYLTVPVDSGIVLAGVVPQSMRLE